MSEQQRGFKKPTDGSRLPADDVEGHAHELELQDEPQDDVQGHGFRFGLQDEPPQDDIDGHVARSGRVVDEPQDGDDVEGHLAVMTP
jgi:hypothetical protein